jgi:hypothetical protein
MMDTKSRLTMDEIRAAIESIASDESNRDQFKALKMLAAEEASTVSLPPPLTDADIVARLARLMAPAGVEMCRRAFRRAFRKTHGQVKIETPPEGDPADELNEEDRRRVGRVHTLRDLYRVAPELKRSGVPPGYPMTGDVLERQAFVQAKAAEYLVAAARGKPSFTPTPVQPTEQGQGA